MDRLESMLGSAGLTHVFVETHAIAGIAIDGLAKRAFALFGELRKFGRVAIVADQAWIRRASKIESTLLPRIS